jgi:WS/DGAT/MGAT family acyltransferase
MQRMSGPDALMLNMETSTTPMHTLKVAILDPSARGTPVTLDELRALIPRYLGHFPRATQRVEALRGHRGRPFWVPDMSFRISNHLDEHTLPGPGEQSQLDVLLASLATKQLSRDRPLWAMTLVHGLQDGRQAVVIRVHHAVVDGLAALNCFRAVTSDTPGAVGAEPYPYAVDDVSPPDRAEMRAIARRDSMRLFRELPQVAADVYRAGVAARRFDQRRAVPHFMGADRTSFNTPSSHRRRCASASIPLADVRQVAVATGTTVNGAFHGIVAGAIRAERLARRERTDRPSVGMFGVCRDLKSPRRQGNELATATVYLHTEITDPIERVRATASSCAAAVALRRQLGFDLTEHLATYTGRLGPWARPIAAPIAPLVMNHITTANMPGPKEHRWIGNVKVEQWTSFALAIAPADVNLTAYSYAGQLSMGLITTPESMADPAAFLGRVQTSLDELTAALHAAEMLDR